MLLRDYSFFMAAQAGIRRALPRWLAGARLPHRQPLQALE
jgi:hypothetical protein